MTQVSHHIIYWLTFAGLGTLLIDTLAYPHGFIGLTFLLTATVIDYWRSLL